MSKVYVFLDTTPVDYTLATDKREAASLTGKWPYYDRSARQIFGSATEKRRWLRRGKMREAGELYNPDKSLGGNNGSMRKHGRCRTSWTMGASAVRPEDV